MDYINELHSHIQHLKTSVKELDKGYKTASNSAAENQDQKAKQLAEQYRELRWRADGELCAFQRALELAEKAGVK